jgi:hypothetical protein
MKKIQLSLSIALICLISVVKNADAQLRRSSFRVDAPSSIQGYKIIEEIDSTSTSPWGTGIDSIWEGFDVVFNASNLDGCNAFPAGSLNGKFALVNSKQLIRCCWYGCWSLWRQCRNSSGNGYKRRW